MTIETAVIGYGLAGKAFHAPLIASLPEFRLRTVVTSRVGEVVADHPQARVVGSPEAALADDTVDLVIVATPNDSHASLARAALLAGKHVVIDKPMVVDPADGHDLVALARSRGRMLSVFHNRRWDADFLTVKRLLAEGTLGEIALAELRWDRFRPEIRDGWKEVPGEGTGVLADLGPHLIDQALELFGYPDAITGDVGRQRPGSLIDDYFEITLRYGTKRVILSAAALLAEPRPRFALHGRAGSFVKHGIDPQEDTLRAGGGPAMLGYGEETPSAFGTLTRADGSSEPVRSERGDWREFYRRMARAILDGAPPPIDPADALAGLSIIECARRSAREGRTLRFTPPS